MATHRTARAGLPYPDFKDRNWHGPLLASLAAIDAANGVGALCVTPADVDAALVPTSLDINVGGGPYRKADGTASVAAGAAGYSLPASSSTKVWLTDGGAVGSGAAWPTAAHVRLATVTTGGSAVTAVADERAVLAAVGGPPVAITGSRTDGTALANLIAALAAGGARVSDTTTP